MDNKKKIEVTQDKLCHAVMDLFLTGAMRELTEKAPTMVLLAPIIGIELWKSLSGESEEND